ncbi:signal transduction histidine kinase [Longilinea arvoryzae]|uniref:histidine kinase n=1 Tax=Longilinea arvoryzae TaxID=360412 RepID=A0A0S7B5E6_9CHLR|nr:ATP-binding protein [Longilinea arvoryzae]GAP12367.1 signal transduction histidine kinase [Longilinea arvoryzae]
MTPSHILVAVTDQQINFLLERVLKSAGYQVTLQQNAAAIKRSIELTSPALVILGEKVEDTSGLDLADGLLRRFPAVPILLFVSQETPGLLKRALQLGLSDTLCLPLRSEDILKAVQSSLAKQQLRKEWVLLESRRATANLQQQIGEMETLAGLARSINGSLDTDSVLQSVVEAAVKLTNADEGSLLLLDDVTGELYMRASRNFQDEFARTFRLPIQDTLAGSVIQSGRPFLLDENTPQKIKTAYLVQNLVYVPLRVHDSVIGVLGIDNREKKIPFRDHDVKLLSALAEFAAIAIVNASQFSSTEAERNKLGTILTRIQDGVVVFDLDQRLVLVNQMVNGAFRLGDENLVGRPLREVFSNPDLLELAESDGKSKTNRVEITVEDGRIFSAQITPISEVGAAITMHDVTNLKKLDSIKSDFVSTVSHDLRSPLTAILGYVELIERAGPVTELQRDFIHRVQISVHNITHLVDDLVELGRIESGFDTRKETVLIQQIIQLVAESMKKQLDDKGQTLQVQLPESLPAVFANPVQIRQMVENILDNARKYTHRGGVISVNGEMDDQQIILQFTDNGIGIPQVDLPFIFDKFYRASNSNNEIPGTGLGLSIVKSIVENHQGRIWVESTLDEGSTFTVVLPVVKN